MLEHYRGKKIGIVGFGVEGKETFRFLKEKGIIPSIFDFKEESLIREENQNFDFAGVEFFTGPNYLQQITNCDVIFKSPGVKNTDVFAEAKEKGTIITSQIKLFFEMCPCQIIGVTGTKGKGTTSTLIFEMLKIQGKDVYLGGNIGIPALSFLDKLTSDSVVVLELSSFQLQDMEQSPHISVVLNITQEHLDYHKDVKEYRDAKMNIVKHQKETDIAIFNADYEVPLEFSKNTKAQKFFVSKIKKTNGCFVDENDNIILVPADITLTSASNLLLRGRHNLENVTAASLAAYFAGVEVENITAVLESFMGLEHRLELVREFGGVKYYNDSFSTVPETAIAAIKAFSQPKIIVLGGSYKGSDYRELGQVISTENIKAIILIGEMATEIDKYIATDFRGQKISGLTKMSEIVEKAREISGEGDVVLLSPACASFGLFENYKDRGNQYREAVNRLK